MKLYDGKKMVNIEMNNWTGNGYTPDWSIDFFEAGSLEYNEDMDAYMVEDVDYCIEQAMDWKNADGDFYEPDTDTSDRNVDVNEVCKELAELKDRKEMDLAGELDEMIALGWTEEEAKDDPEAFLDRIGEEYKEGLTEEDIWRVWANVIEGRDVNEIKFIVKRTETYEGKDMVTYRQESGFFEKSKDTALRYSSYEDAEYAVELERDDPKYDKSFMGECKFEIEEV